MKNLVKTTSIFALAFALTANVSCKKEETKEPETPTPSLYSKVGGTTMVTDPANSSQMIEQGRLSLRAVVDSSILVIAGDPKLQPYFSALLSEVTAGNTTNLAVLSKNLTDFFCVATGSKNYSYNGLDMVSAHDPANNPRMAMKSDDAAFDQFINDVVIGAQKNNVPNDIIQEVGALIETLRSDVVQK